MEDNFNTNTSIGFQARGYNRTEADFVLDRSFSQFGQQETPVEKTVDQFFVDYEDLFYEIPVQGDINSHEYLIRKSSELYNIEKTSEDIQPLLDEITLLRSQSVADQQTIIDLRTQLASAGRAGDTSETVTSLRTQLAEAILEEGNY